MKTFLKLLGIAAGIAAAFGLMAWIDHATTDRMEIPKPPPGQHYCTNGNELGFCYDTPSHEWR